MKKLLSVILSMAMLLSAFTVTSFAAETTTRYSYFDIDSFGLEDGTAITTDGVSGYYKANTANSYYIKQDSSNTQFTVNGEKGSNQTGKITMTANVNSYRHFTTLYAGLNANENSGSVALRSDNIAFTFKIKAPSGVTWDFLVSGRSSTATGSKEGTKYSHTILETTSATSGNLYVRSYVKDAATSGDNVTKTELEGVAPRNTWLNVKLIFNYTSGSYDVYINDVLIANDQTLAGTKYLSDFKLRTLKSSGYGERVIEIDDIEVYSMADADINAQLQVNQTTGGKITVNDTVTTATGISYTVTPDEGYYVKKVLLGDIEQTAISAEGGTYTLTAPSQKGTVLTAEFVEKRKFKKEFGLNFDTLTEENVYNGSTLSTCSVNSLSYGSVTRNNGATSVAANVDGSMGIKINLPMNSSVPRMAFNLLWQKNGDLAGKANEESLAHFTSLVTEPFAISYKLNLTENAFHTLQVYDRGENAIGGSILCEATSESISNYSYISTTDAIELKKRISVSGTHEYKYIINPKTGTMDFYLDGDLLHENIKLKSSSTLYYFQLIIKSSDKTKEGLAYFDELAFYTLTEAEIGIQPDINQSGNGNVTSSKAVIGKGEAVSYTMTPNTGNFIKDIFVNGEPVAAFNADSAFAIELVDTNTKNTIDVVFEEYEESTPAVTVSPLAVKTPYATYVFCKISENGADVSEYGLLISGSNEEPVPNGENTDIVPCASANSSNGLTANRYGYYGYMIVNHTGIENKDFYIRPYAKIGNDYVLGEISHIEPASIEMIGE